MKKNRRAETAIGEVELWSIWCDICGSPMTDVEKVGKGRGKTTSKRIAEFLSAGAEELHAINRGWIVEGKTAICKECLNSIGK